MPLSIVPVLLASATPVALPADAIPPLPLAGEETTLALAQQGEPLPQPPAAAAGGDAPPAEQPITGDDVIIVEGAVGPPPGDPAAQLNEAVFDVAQDLDRAVIGPVAEVYEDDLPKPLRNGLRNFLRNLLEPVNAINFMLQLKPGKAFETLGRFVINSTVGVAGLFDVASDDPFNLPWRRNGLANTLGYYGVGPGPYFYLPLIGATTLRDMFGSLVDQAVVPFIVGPPLDTPYYAVPAYTISSLQFRMEFDETLGEIRDSIDPYTALREYYLCRREREIEALHNRPPPRDCRIAALMGELDEEPVAAAPSATGAMTIPTVAPVAPAPVEPAPPVEEVPAEPAFISEPVVQPLAA
ncbi:MlaA family lipoprotein [Alteraurantiacibacter buctensis]|uniref:VacJ family lipoprotein n=1 Tax=Alteraurantiacibacter buctensis TaxID=1503981 RepID=A0A844Z2D5_9SPHN|nr:VacJ family lipoprotein [Alteraurantiacibacter buctensis]MXO72063.1 VacJ family lipoprotein [Alteraurantiacibacter buctensis]